MNRHRVCGLCVPGPILAAAEQGTAAHGVGVVPLGGGRAAAHHERLRRAGGAVRAAQVGGDSEFATPQESADRTQGGNPTNRGSAHCHLLVDSPNPM